MAINPAKSISASEALHRRDYANLSHELELERDVDTGVDFVSSGMTVQEFKASGKRYEQFTQRYKHKLNYLKSKIQHRLNLSDAGKSVLSEQIDEFVRGAFDDSGSKFKRFNDQQLEDYVYSGMYQNVSDFTLAVDEATGAVPVDEILTAMLIFTPEIGTDPAWQQFCMEQAIQLIKERREQALQLPRHQAQRAKEETRSRVFLAVAYNKYKTAYLLLRARENLSVRDTDEHGRNALHILAYRGQPEHAAQLAALSSPRFNPSVTDNYGNHALHLAVASGSVQTAETMIKAIGANAFSANNAGKTPLHIAAEMKDNDMLSMLLAHAKPEEINAQDQNGNTAAAIAAQMSNPTAVRQLVRAGANPALMNHADQSLHALMTNMAGAVSVRA